MQQYSVEAPMAQPTQLSEQDFMAFEALPEIQQLQTLHDLAHEIIRADAEQTFVILLVMQREPNRIKQYAFLNNLILTYRGAIPTTSENI